MIGSESGVAARNPVQTRIADNRANPGIYSIARLTIRSRIGRSTFGSGTSSCRDDPTRTCPVRLGWTLNATESSSDAWALLR